MSHDAPARLIHMANQIARNLAIQGPDQAARATAAHIGDFWEPRMRSRIYAVLDDDPDALDPIARQALTRLRQTDSAAAHRQG